MDLTEQQWSAIAPMFPEEERVRSRPKGGRPFRDPRDALNGDLWILRTGAPRKDLPEGYPPHTTCHRRFQRWVEDGVLHRVLLALAEDLKYRGKLDLSEAYIDGSHAGAKGGLDAGNTCRGKATKIMAVADRNGLPVADWTTSGERHETRLVIDTLDARFVE